MTVMTSISNNAPNLPLSPTNTSLAAAVFTTSIYPMGFCNYFCYCRFYSFYYNFHCHHRHRHY
jgi:hypothetical protein